MPEFALAALILAAAYVIVAVGRGITGLAYAYIERQAEGEYRKGQAEYKALIVQMFSTVAPMLLQAFSMEKQGAARRRAGESAFADLFVQLDSVIRQGMPRKPDQPEDSQPEYPPAGAGGPVPEKMPSAT